MDLKQELNRKVVRLQEEMRALYASEKQKILSKVRQSFIEEVVASARQKAEALADQQLGNVEKIDPEEKFDPEWSGQQGWVDPNPDVKPRAKNDAPAIIAMTQGKARKPRRPKITKGFTPSEELSPMVLGLLVQHGPMKKSQIAAELLKEKVLNNVDLEKHPDGKPRYYKTLDRVRKQLMAGNHIVAKKGTWELAPVHPWPPTNVVRIVEEI